MHKLVNFEKKHAAKKLLILRVVVGAIFIAHGIAKFGMWQTAPSADMPAAMLWILRILSIVEPIVGVTMILGLFVPLGALIFAIIMLGAVPAKIFVFGAVFTGGWSYDLLILASSLVLASHGGGMLSLDGMMAKKKSTPVSAPQTPPQTSSGPGMPQV